MTTRSAPSRRPRRTSRGRRPRKTPGPLGLSLVDALDEPLVPAGAACEPLAAVRRGRRASAVSPAARCQSRVTRTAGSPSRSSPASKPTAPSRRGGARGVRVSAPRAPPAAIRVAEAEEEDPGEPSARGHADGFRRGHPPRPPRSGSRRIRGGRANPGRRGRRARRGRARSRAEFWTPTRRTLAPDGVQGSPFHLRLNRRPSCVTTAYGCSCPRVHRLRFRGEDLDALVGS